MRPACQVGAVVLCLVILGIFLAAIWISAYRYEFFMTGLLLCPPAAVLAGVGYDPDNPQSKKE